MDASSRFVTLLMGSLMIAAAPGGSSDDAASWQEVIDKNDIKVLQRALPNSQLIEFRSIGTVHAPLLSVAAVIWDANRGNEWMANCVQSFIIEKRGGGDAVVYNRVKTGPFMADRDVVVQTKVEVLATEKSLRFTFHNIEDARKQPADGVVRMPRLEGSFTLHEMAPGLTAVSYQVISDPAAGSLPSWVVSRFARDLPFDTLVNLRKQADKPGHEAAGRDLQKVIGWTSFDVPAQQPVAPSAEDTPH